MLILCTNITLVNASDLEKGNPEAIYLWDRIILSNGNEVDLGEYATLLFLNGTLITDYEIIIRNGRTLVPVRLIAEGLGACVEWDESNRAVTITQSQKEVALEIDSKVAFVSGIKRELDYKKGEEQV
jgi:hypothetical protein